LSYAGHNVSNANAKCQMRKQKAQGAIIRLPEKTSMNCSFA